jgi:hypothetical protein
VLCEVQDLLYFAFVSRFYKFKWPIQTVEHDLLIEISLEIKFYIFLNVLLFFRWGKSLILNGAEIVTSINFVPI